MRGNEGPLLGAMIIGVGLGYIVTLRTGNILYGIGAGLAVATADYLFLSWMQRFKKKK